MLYFSFTSSLFWSLSFFLLFCEWAKKKVAEAKKNEQKKNRIFFFVKWRTSEKTHTNLRKEELIKGTKRGRVFFFMNILLFVLKHKKYKDFSFFFFSRQNSMMKIFKKLFVSSLILIKKWIPFIKEICLKRRRKEKLLKILLFILHKL